VGRDPGAIKDWLVLGPIPVRQDQTDIEGLDAELVKDEARLQPRPGGHVQTAGGVSTWRAVRLKDYSMDFNDLFGQVSERAAVYAVCYVSAPVPRSNIKLLVGSDDQAKIYWNSQEVYRQTETRAANPDQDTVSGVKLKAGRNVLVFKVVNGTHSWGGSVRLADAEGRPIPELSVALSPR
jgi:hypothetical protein